MKPYESWEFCKSIDCTWLCIKDKEYRKQFLCESCLAFKLHQYLKEHGQILEEGSKLNAVIDAAHDVIADYGESLANYPQVLALAKALAEWEGD